LCRVILAMESYRVSVENGDGMDLTKPRSALKERVQSLAADSGRIPRRPIYNCGVASFLVVALMSLPGSSASSTAVRSTQFWTVQSGGFSIQVPASWKVGAPSDQLCLSSASTTVVVGTPRALAGCGGFNPVLEFGHGGPPFPPIPASNPDSEKINGVKIQVLRGTDTLTGGTPANYLLATLDGWNNWLLYVADGKSASSALAPAYRVLKSIHAPPHFKPSAAIKENFVGNWGVHDASLQITSDSTGIRSLGGGAGCSAGIRILGCEIHLALKLALSRDHTYMTATVTKVKAYLDPTTFEIDPKSTNVPAVGNMFQLRFVEPGLMIETNLHYAWNRSGVFDPWWCEPSQAMVADNYCGD
jgi:hypothetical protein